MRLRTRFAVALAAVALVLSATSLAGFALYRDAIADQERAELTRASESVASQFGAVITEQRQMVQLWATAPALREHGTPDQTARLSSFVRSSGFDGASVVAANGTMTAIYSRGLTDAAQAGLIGQDFSDRTYVQRALAGETYISDPVDAETGNLIVTVSTPLTDDGEVVGTFNAAFHVGTGELLDIVQANTGPSQEVRIVANGSTIYRTGPTGDLGLVANATVDETGWVVSAATPRDTHDSRLWSVTLLQLGAVALVVLSVAAFGRWVYREFVGNFERLQTGFDALVDGDYGSTVALSGSAEWQHLEDEFNELSGTLAQRRTEVIVLNRVLRHNLRNAMTVVIGNAETIETQTDDESIAADAGRIRRRSESLLDLADHARAVESALGGTAAEAAPYPIGELVAETVADLSGEFADAEIRLGPVPEGLAVPGGDLLSVAVDELIRNAVVHSDDAPTVTVDVTADEETVRVVVADDGPGLPPVERRVLTEPFVETPTEHGSGLGLWVVNWLVRWADGTIDVVVDDGTTVTVTLPRVQLDDGEDGE